jgi:hypothetical protein
MEVSMQDEYITTQQLAERINYDERTMFIGTKIRLPLTLTKSAKCSSFAAVSELKE